MPGKVFYWLLSMSLIASATGLLVLLIGRIRRIPRRVAVLLWLVPFLRMCVPFALSSPYSLISLFLRFAGKRVEVFSVTPALSFYAMNTVTAAESYAPFTYRLQSVKRVFDIAGGVWLVVALALLLAFCILYFGTLRELKDARPLQGNVYVSEKVQSPAVYGVFRPRIVLPAQYGADLTYVLLHENAHIRRKDNLWRLLAFFAAAAHWFNPLAWLFLKRFLSELELACDESVAARLEEPQRREYARALLAAAEQKSLFAAAFGGAKVRTRIENVISYKKMTWFAALGFALFAAAVLFVLLTN